MYSWFRFSVYLSFGKSDPLIHVLMVLIVWKGCKFQMSGFHDVSEGTTGTSIGVLQRVRVNIANPRIVVPKNEVGVSQLWPCDSMLIWSLPVS